MNALPPIARVPRLAGKTVTLAHGGGGSAMRELVDEVFVRAFGGAGAPLEDQARFALAGRGPGSRVTPGELEVTVAVTDVRGLERVDVIVNGEVRHQHAFAGERDGALSFSFAGAAGDWCLVEAFGADGGYALTNPVFVDTASPTQ